jgi:subtilisin-like proprotein convertase family protein
LATHFNDSAATPIGSGVAPFAGAFIPDQPLESFNGEEESGTWKLRVADTATLDTGTIGCARIKVTRFN